MMRTHRAGDLRAEHVGAEVVVCGWVAHRRDHGGVVFLDVRDTAGLVQVVVDPEQAGCEAAHRVRNEWVLRVSGAVRPRPDGTVNADLPTGAIEVGATAVEVLNEADPSPFPLDERTDIDEVLRLRHRYLDLRRAPMQRNLRVRAEVNRAMREAMRAQDFVEVETPMLIASTPEGARDFVVPSRLRPGSFYALPQSPQLFKQLLMVGGTRSLLPDRALPPRRRPARRPPVRVHAARRGDELRRSGRRARRGVPRRARRRGRDAAR